MITVLTGANAYLLSETKKRIVDDFIRQNGSTAVEVVNASDLTVKQLVASMQARSLFSEKRLLIINDLSVNKNITEHIQDVLDADNVDTVALIVEQKFDKRTALYKLLKQKTDFRVFDELNEQALINWIVEYAKDRNGKLSHIDAQYILQRVGVDQLRLANEIDKLALYNSVISKKTIDMLTVESVHSTVFNLLDAAFAGQTKKTLELYREQRQAKVEPQAILGMLGWQLHILALVKSAEQQHADEIARQAKISPFVVRKTMTLAKNRTIDDVRNLVRRVLDVDIQLKSASINADDALQELLLEITSL